MTNIPFDIEPANPANADFVAEWCDDESAGVHRYYTEPEWHGVALFGFQRFDGTEHGRAVRVRGVDREFTVSEARALGMALLDAAERV